MLLKGLIVFFVFLLIVAICALVYLLLKNKDHQALARGLEPESEEEITIEKLEELAGDKTLSKNELFELIISFLDKEAKKKNPSYVAEIEDSERIGIENRKNRR